MLKLLRSWRHNRLQTRISKLENELNIKDEISFVGIRKLNPSTLSTDDKILFMFAKFAGVGGILYAIFVSVYLSFQAHWAIPFTFFIDFMLVMVLKMFLED